VYVHRDHITNLLEFVTKTLSSHKYQVLLVVINTSRRKQDCRQHDAIKQQK